MGGRYPKSKRGKIVFEDMEVPDELRQQLIWRLEELAENLGYELTQKGYAKDRVFGIVGEHVRYNEIAFQGLKEVPFEGVRE